MSIETLETAVRVTALADAHSSASCTILHRRDWIFDINAFSRAEGRVWHVVPASSPHGVPWADLPETDELLVDKTVMDCKQIQVFDDSTPHLVVPTASIRSARVVTVCSPARPLAGQTTPAEQITNAVTTFTGRRLRQRLDQTLEIPPLPLAAQKIIALKSNPNYSLADLVKVVETDPSIAAKVMAWACSAFYAADPAPRSLNDAIMRVLGFDLVMNIALGLALAGTLRLPAHHVNGMPPFWTEAVFTAAAMEALGRRQTNGRDQAGLHYLTGLLANFGTLILGHVFPPQYEVLCRLQEANPDVPINQLDNHVLTLSREMLAAEIFELWELPAPTVAAVRHQNDRECTGEHAADVRLLQASRAMLGYGHYGPDAIASLELEAIGIDEDDLTAVSDLLLDSRESLESLARAVA
jgi:HD-like signal output (HDOD) protein